MAFWESVWQAFPKTLGGEGIGLPYMYLDNKGYVTTGSGNLIEAIGSATPWSPALPLAWIDPATGQTASDDVIIEQWKAVKARQDLAKDGGGPTGPFPALTTIRLSSQSLTKFVEDSMDSMIATLESYFPAIGGWPADAQFAILRWSWAMGPNRFSPANGTNYWPKLTAALKQTMPDFDEAAVQSSSNDLAFQTQADIKQGFENGQDVLDRNLDASVLYFPGYPPGSGGEGTGFFPKAVAVAAGVGLSYLAYTGFSEFLKKTPEKA